MVVGEIEQKFEIGFEWGFVEELQADNPQLF